RPAAGRDSRSDDTDPDRLPAADAGGTGIRGTRIDERTAWRPLPVISPRPAEGDARRATYDYPCDRFGHVLIVFYREERGTYPNLVRILQTSVRMPVLPVV
ncbi:MAG TPA: hypothetical protein VKA37_12480, partial [Halobacteriales archaeon]|nr:hypothetical protein [Halobacteriales archaeon]